MIRSKEDYNRWSMISYQLVHLLNINPPASLGGGRTKGRCNSTLQVLIFSFISLKYSI